MTLAEFLLARWDEDEEVARAAMLPGNYTHYADSAAGECIEMAAGEGCSERGVDHWRRWDPARVLAECEARRRIVELHEHPEGSCWEMHRGVYGPGWPEGSYAVEGQPWSHPSLESPDVHPGPCETLQLLALPYADHPEFREEWKP